MKWTWIHLDKERVKKITASIAEVCKVENLTKRALDKHLAAIANHAEYETYSYEDRNDTLLVWSRVVMENKSKMTAIMRIRMLHACECIINEGLLSWEPYLIRATKEDIKRDVALIKSWKDSIQNYYESQGG